MLTINIPNFLGLLTPAISISGFITCFLGLSDEQYRMDSSYPLCAEREFNQTGILSGECQNNCTGDEKCLRIGRNERIFPTRSKQEQTLLNDLRHGCDMFFLKKCKKMIKIDLNFIFDIFRHRF